MAPLVDAVHIDEKPGRRILGPLDEAVCIARAVRKGCGEIAADVVIADHQPRLERACGQNIDEHPVALGVTPMGEIAGDHNRVRVRIMGFDIGEAGLEIGHRVMVENGLGIDVDVGNMDEFHCAAPLVFPRPCRMTMTG